MVPFWISKITNFNVIIAAENIEGLVYEGGINEIKFLKIKKYSRKSTINVLIFLLKNYKTIDILHQYHICFSTLLICLAYKILCFIERKKYITYIKLDISPQVLNYLSNYRILNYFSSKLLTHISVEFKKDYEIIKKIDQYKNIFFISNTYALPDNFDKFNNIDKENIILHVTRVGTYQKNTEELLSILPKFFSEINGWKIYIIGPHFDSIDDKINNFQSQNPELNDKVLFMGEINSKETMDKIYAKSKISILTSRWEGYPLALVEARRWGLKIITTEVKGVNEILEGHSCSWIYKSGDKATLLKYLKISVDDDDYFLTKTYENERNFYSSNNQWPNKLRHLSINLEKEVDF